MIEVNGHSCVNIDHYEAVGILKAAGSVIALLVEREEYPDGMLADGYQNNPISSTRNLPPPLHTSSNDIFCQNPQDPAQISPQIGQNLIHGQTSHTNGIKLVSGCILIVQSKSRISLDVHIKAYQM